MTVAAADIIDTELLDAFEEYSGFGGTSVERVRFVLMKLDSDRRHGTDYFANKFIGKVEAIFSGLPKPKEWQSLLNNDLPLLTSIDEDVQEISILAIRPCHFQQRQGLPLRLALGFGSTPRGFGAITTGRRRNGNVTTLIRFR